MCQNITCYIPDGCENFKKAIINGLGSTKQLSEKVYASPGVWVGKMEHENLFDLFFFI